MRFIHTGDLHLGLQFKDVNFSREKARKEDWNCGIPLRGLWKRL